MRTAGPQRGPDRAFGYGLGAVRSSPCLPLTPRDRCRRAVVRALERVVTTPLTGLAPAGLALAVLACVDPPLAAQGPLVGGNVRISEPTGLPDGVDGDRQPAVGYSPVDDLFLVVYERTVTRRGNPGTTLVGRFLDGEGATFEVGECSISGVPRSWRPRIAYSPILNDFLVAFQVDAFAAGDPCGPGRPVDSIVMVARVGYRAGNGCGGAVVLGDPFTVGDFLNLSCDPVRSEQPDVAWGFGDFLVTWTVVDDTAARTMVVGQFVSGLPRGGDGGSELLGPRWPLLAAPQGGASFRQSAVSADPDDGSFAVVARLVDRGGASTIVAQAVTPARPNGAPVYATYPIVAPGATAAGRPDLAFGRAGGHHLIVWPDARLHGETTRDTVWAQRGRIRIAGYTPVGPAFLVSGDAGGVTSGHAEQCRVAYDATTADRFVVVYDRSCRSRACAGVDAAQCLLRIVAGDPRSGVGDLVGSPTPLVDAAGREPAQTGPAIAFGARRGTALATWQDDRPDAAVTPRSKIVAQRLRSSLEQVRTGASGLGSYRAGDTAHLQVFGPPLSAAPLAVLWSTAPLAPPLALPPPFVGSLCIAPPIEQAFFGGLDADGAWVSPGQPIPPGVSGTVWVQTVVASAGRLYTTDCVRLTLSP